jgi:ribosomal protein L7/L12
MRTELVEPIKVHTPLVEYGAGINVEKGLYLHAKPDVDLVMKAIEPAKEKLKYLKAASDNVKLKLREAKDYVHEYLIDNDNNNEK